MRLRSTLILLLILLAFGGYMYFVERPKQEAAGKKATLYAVESDEVTSVTLTYADREVELVKDGDAWKLTKPVQAAGDESAVKNLVNSIVTCEIAKELSEPSTDLEGYGLVTPFVTVSVGAKGDTPLPSTRFGKTTPVGGSAYAQRDGEKAVLLVSSSCRFALDKQIKDLRDKTLIEFKDDEVQAFQIERPGELVGVERKDGAWQLKPGGHKGDDNAIRTYLSSLRTLRAVEFVDDPALDLSIYGLDNPRLRVRMRLDDSSEKTVELGKELDSKNVYVQVLGRDGVYEVGEYTYRNLDKTGRDLRDKTVLPFEVDALQSIEVTRQAGGHYKIMRSGETWTVEGLEGTPNTDVLHEYVGDVHDLSGYEIITDTPSELASYGFDNPLLRIALTGKDEKALGTILIGQIPQDETLDMTAMVEGSSTVYKLRAYVFTRLDRDPATLVEAPPATTPQNNP